MFVPWPVGSWISVSMEGITAKLDAKFIIFSTQDSSFFNAKFIIFNAKFIIFNAKSHLIANRPGATCIGFLASVSKSRCKVHHFQYIFSSKFLVFESQLIIFDTKTTSFKLTCQ